ncbi:MAG TPA: ABC transporter ATP-binding protein [Steroidobacteraceae bacterium]|jgi:ABC-type multidrug transport system fused ATPase/permease subunit|nr:ABC transporter ATP-binding protein [Steroidobacteraceae bacterium]
MSFLSDIWSVLNPRQRRRVIAAQFISFAMAISTVTGIAAIIPFFAVLGDPGEIDRHPLLQWLYAHGDFAGKYAFVATLGIGFIAAVLISNFINAVGSMSMIRTAFGIGDQLQAALFEEYLSRPYLFHTRTHSATLFSNVIYEPRRLSSGIIQNGFVLVTNAAAGTLIFLSVLLLSPAISIGMLLCLGGGYALIYLRVRKRLRRLGRGRSGAWAEQTRTVTESFGAIREILLLEDRGAFRQRFEHVSRTISEADTRIQFFGQTPRYIMECLAVSALVGIALAVGGQARAGDWLGKLTFVAFAAYRLLPIMQQAFVAVVKIGADRAGFALIADDLRLAQSGVARSAQGQAAITQPPWQECPREEIVLQDLSFRYGAERSAALQGIDLRIPARATVALVGANGSGKTTLMDLIAGLLVPTTGELRIDGILLDDANRAAWRTRIAYVPQSTFILDASIAENIAFGVHRSAIDARRLTEAARLAQLEKLVEALPGGYDHRLGERGIVLSAGQRQRIGIARALYRNRPVLLLDEATSALDEAAEAELIAALVGLRGRCTVILIAHGSRMVRSCDVVFELENGRVRGSGCHLPRAAAR